MNGSGRFSGEARTPIRCHPGNANNKCFGPRDLDKGESLDYVTSSRSVYFIFLLALVVAHLVMAALYESYIHPLVILLKPFDR